MQPVGKASRSRGRGAWQHLVLVSGFRSGLTAVAAVAAASWLCRFLCQLATKSCKNFRTFGSKQSRAADAAGTKGQRAEQG